MLGSEPLWQVLVFGGLFIVALMQGMSYAVDLVPLTMPGGYALALGFALLSIFEGALAWWAVALWRTGGRQRSVPWRYAARLAAVLCIVHMIWYSDTLIDDFVPDAGKRVVDGAR